MDFRMYDNAIGKFYGMDALSEKNHYLSPFQFGNGNPVFWADPTGLDVESGKDVLGRDKFDRWGMYIPGFERGDAQYSAIDAGDSGGGGFGIGSGSVNVIVLIFSPEYISQKKVILPAFDGWEIIWAINVQDAFNQLNEFYEDGEIDNLLLWAHGNPNGLAIGSYFSENGVVNRSFMWGKDFDAFSRGESHREHLTDLQFEDMTAFRNITKKVKDGGNYIIGNCQVGANEITVSHILNAGELHRVNVYFNVANGGFDWTNKSWSIRSANIVNNTSPVIHHYQGSRRQDFSDLIINNNKTNPITFIR